MTPFLTFTTLLVATVLQRAIAEPQCACDDFSPPGIDCLDQLRVGNCFAPGMVEGGFCKLTCDRCDLCWEVENQAVTRDCNCPDIEPSGGFTCEQQASFGKCSQQWMLDGGYCQGTCCACPNTATDDPKCACDDLQPPGEYTCAQQESWGKCSEDWIISGGYCQGTCCACPIKPECDCEDVQPPGDYTCDQQVSWGKCSEDWMISGGYCQGSCCKCPVKPGCDCEDVQPPGAYTCAQQVSWGKCTEQWMIDGGFCANSCDRCECPTPETESILDFDDLEILVVNHGSDEVLLESSKEDSTAKLNNELNKVEILDALIPPFDKGEVANAIVTHSFLEYYHPYQKEAGYQEAPIYVS